MSQTSPHPTPTEPPTETGPEPESDTEPDADTAGASTDDGSQHLPDATPEAGEDALTKDDLFHLLQNGRRRAVLRYLQGREGETIRMRDVAEQVAAWEHDTTLEALTSDERQRVYIALYQSHLDKLADAGVIEYNKPRGVLRTTPLFEAVVGYVDIPDAEAGADGDRRWEQRYLGVSAISSVLLIGSVLELTVLQVLSGFMLSLLILGMFSGLTFLRVLDSAGYSVGEAVLPSA